MAMKKKTGIVAGIGYIMNGPVFQCTRYVVRFNQQPNHNVSDRPEAYQWLSIILPTCQALTRTFAFGPPGEVDFSRYLMGIYAAGRQSTYQTHASSTEAP